MRQRPVADLLQALDGLGADARSDLGTGCPPVTIEASGLDGGLCLREGRRLQPVPQRAPDGAAVRPETSRRSRFRECSSRSPISSMTLAVMEAFGVKVGEPEVPAIRRLPGTLPRPRLRDRARRLRRQLLFRPGRDHGGHDHRRGARQTSSSRETSPSSTSSSTWAARSNAAPTGRR